VKAAPSSHSHTSLEADAATRNTDWAAQGLARFERHFSTGQTPTAEVDGAQRLLFSSSNYLGLAEDPIVIDAAINAARTLGAGSGGSRLTTGTLDAHRQLEAHLAGFFNYPAAVFFATGYQANLSTISAIVGKRGDDFEIFSDQYNHASIIDGARIARARVRVFKHCDYDDLEAQLATRTRPHALVISDGLFSMHGTCADVPRIVELARSYGAWSYIDDAHGVGTLGPTGRGTCELQGAWPDVLVGTASKALGGEGGYACCGPEVATLLRNQARSYVFSTSNSPMVIAAVDAALSRVDAALVSRLQSRARLLRELLRAAGVGVAGLEQSAIIPVHVGDELLAVEAAAALQDRGIQAPAIRYPTVPRGQAILRLTVMATHSDEQVKECARVLAEIFENLGLTRPVE